MGDRTGSERGQVGKGKEQWRAVLEICKSTWGGNYGRARREEQPDTVGESTQILLPASTVG